MTIQLSHLATDAILPHLLQQSRKFLNIDEQTLRAALGTIVPVVLSGVMNQAATQAGALSLHRTLFNSDGIDTNITRDLGSAFSGDASTQRLITQGSELLKSLFGYQAQALGVQIASVSGSPAVSTTSILAMVTPVILDQIHLNRPAGRPDARSFVALLAAQATPTLEASLPEPVTQWLSWGSPTDFFSSLRMRLAVSLSSMQDSKNSASTGLLQSTPVELTYTGKSNLTHKSGGWWTWLLIALGAILLITLFRACTNHTTATTPEQASTEPQTAKAAQIERAVEPSLTLRNDDGHVTVEAGVSSEAEKIALMERLKTAFGDGNFGATIKVDSAVNLASWPDDWTEKIGTVLPLLKLPGSELSISGNQIVLGGIATDPKLGLLDKIKTQFGEMFSVSSSNFSIGDALTAAKEKFQTGLSSLATDSCEADILVGVVNQYIINFPSGTNAIPKADLDELAKTIVPLKACAGRIKLEIGGHTDNVGDEQLNAKLSTERADAVARYLIASGVPAEMLNIKGYGATRPLASNLTIEGRFKNRRIEFTKQL